MIVQFFMARKLFLYLLAGSILGRTNFKPPSTPLSDNIYFSTVHNIISGSAVKDMLKDRKKWLVVQFLDPTEVPPATLTAHLVRTLANRKHSAIWC
jgi:hypothetical protein